jgi:hypothetical protein
VLVLGALLVGGCGSSSSGVTPAAYVKSVCTSLGTWSDAIKTAGTKLQAAATGTTSLSTGKQQYQTFVDALVTDTSHVSGELKSAGTPAVKDGKALAGQLVQAFTRAQAGLTQAAKRAAAIPTTSASGYQAALAGVTASIKQDLAGIASAHPEQDPQLRAAAAKDPACLALKNA